jgi:hypothetical protein
VLSFKQNLVIYVYKNLSLIDAKHEKLKAL